MDLIALKQELLVNLQAVGSGRKKVRFTEGGNKAPPQSYWAYFFNDFGNWGENSEPLNCLAHGRLLVEMNLTPIRTLWQFQDPLGRRYPSRFGKTLGSARRSWIL